MQHGCTQNGFDRFLTFLSFRGAPAGLGRAEAHPLDPNNFFSVSR